MVDTTFVFHSGRDVTRSVGDGLRQRMAKDSLAGSYRHCVHCLHLFATKNSVRLAKTRVERWLDLPVQEVGNFGT
jgi:hypothetical protein